MYRQRLHSISVISYRSTKQMLRLTRTFGRGLASNSSRMTCFRKTVSLTRNTNTNIMQFSSMSFRFQETNKNKINEEDNAKESGSKNTTDSALQNDSATATDATRKRKPLSRLPVGGSSDSYSKQTMKNSTIEFSTWKAMLLFVVVGCGMTYIFVDQKKKVALRKEADANRGVGKPLIGGPFNLIDTEGKEFTHENLKGKFSLVYFGFTHCPDICPDELDKLGLMLNGLKNKYSIDVQPIFITCDPARDSPEVIKEYLTDFHPDIIGLTGDYDEVKNCCKNYRVYFSTPRDVKPGQDYLVDHSIFFYLMDPEGEFIDVLGRQYEAVDAVEKIKSHIDAYQPKEVREKQKEGFFGFIYK